MPDIAVPKNNTKKNRKNAESQGSGDQHPEPVGSSGSGSRSGDNQKSARSGKKASPSRLFPAATRSQTRWGQLYGSARSLAIAEYARSTESMLVVVASSMPELLRTESELEFFTDDATEVTGFVEWETLPYDWISPHQDIISQRIRALYGMSAQSSGILLVTASALMQRLAPQSFFDQHALIIDGDETLDPEPFRKRLVDAGYRNVSQVEEHGEFSHRGAIVDLFPMTCDHPLRIEFFDNEIESIRSFDVDTQRSIDRVSSIELLPAHEFPLNEEGIQHFRREFRNAFDVDRRNCPVYQAVSEGRAPAGIEYYSPLFFEEMASLFDYLPPQAEFIFLDNAETALDEFWESTAERYEQRRHDVERPILDPSLIYLSPEQTRESLQQRHCIHTQSFEIELNGSSNNPDEVLNFPCQAPGVYPVNARAEKPMALLQEWINSYFGKILLVAESTGRRETLLDQLVGNGIKPKSFSNWQEFLASDDDLGLTTAPLDQGLNLQVGGEMPGVAVVTETQLGTGRVRQRERRRATRDSDAIIANLTDLSIGAPVVHIDHGVGRYQGLTLLDVGDIETEFLTISYAGEDKLYVPVAALHLISRYAGSSEDGAPLHKLGSDHWQKVKRKAAEKAHDVAAELLEIHARRAARKGTALIDDASNYEMFASAFPFEETPDQYNAINAVVEDLRAERPTDRVVCGDVGFGKTEVAMRAAFVAVDAGKQVAVLVPTTLLAQQHHQNFLDRFSDWAMQIESVSRFKSASEHKQILERLATGKIDIIIGTHRLIQKDVKYKNLGLVIIDEEHRFGVRHKEHMKTLRSEIDIITLTATPIPRTLSMGLSGLRDLSIIATPPPHRHAIKTIVCEWSDNQIREACARELARGGQVYFLHNEVATIDRIARTLEELMPQAKVGVGHGQMRESELEAVMYDFYHQRFNIFVSTTIIESGIDVPSANTIIINRADKLGLAQLHQLRGRVGRSHHRAYAYLLTPPIKTITSDAKKRLEAIESLEELGVGFTLATHDLEIRGAGELLGEGQSGQIQEIGFTLYTQLLERAVSALKSGKLPDYDEPLARSTEIDVGAPALLPDAYVPDVHLRLILYKRISHAADSEELRELKIELIDRFGLLPSQTENLFVATRLRQRCALLGIERLELSDSGGRILFNDNPSIDPMVLIQLIQKHPDQYRFDGKKVLRFSKSFDTEQARFDFTDQLLDKLENA